MSAESDSKETPARAAALTAYPLNIREEELKNKVGAGWFGAFDCTRIGTKEEQKGQILLYMSMLLCIMTRTRPSAFAKNSAS